jgi:hypothetical protein
MLPLGNLAGSTASYKNSKFKIKPREQKGHKASCFEKKNLWLRRLEAWCPQGEEPSKFPQ